PSMSGLSPVSGTGTSCTSTSPISIDRSTKRRRRNFSVSILDMLPFPVFHAATPKRIDLRGASRPLGGLAAHYSRGEVGGQITMRLRRGPWPRARQRCPLGRGYL